MIRHCIRTEITLSNVAMNHEMILCYDPHYIKESHKNAIDIMYGDISAVREASELFSTNRDVLMVHVIDCYMPV